MNITPRPPNPLNEFVTYNAHFELHLSNTWDELRAASETMSNLATTRREGVGSLLINTRKDAHQHIDNVKFTTITPKANPTAGGTATVELSLEVSEPGGAFFIEKVMRQAEKYNCTNVQHSMVWGLKIIFAGRTALGEEKIIPMKYMIPLTLLGMTARYDHRGGDYQLTFIANGTVTNRPGKFSMMASYTNKNIVISAKTVQEALKKLEERLQGNYDTTYELDLKNEIGARRIVYKINPAADIVGDLSLINREAYDDSKNAKINLKATDPISSMIMQILQSSKEINDRVANSRDALRTQFQEGVEIPVINTRYLLKADVAEIIFDVFMYRGGGFVYEFDYYFAGAGKNVDIINFEMKIPNAEILTVTNNNSSLDLNTNASASAQTDFARYHAANNVHPDVTRERLYEQVREPISIPGAEGDVAPLSYPTAIDRRGNAAIETKNVSAYKRAFKTYAEFAGATDITVSFTLRGHLELLQLCVSYPDWEDSGGALMFGLQESCWVKVNIKDDEGQPFFYTGYYDVLTVENVFSGGMFTQNLVVMMKSGLDGVQSTVGTVAETTPRPNPSVTQQPSPDPNTPPAARVNQANGGYVVELSGAGDPPGLGAAVGITRRRINQ